MKIYKTKKNFTIEKLSIIEHLAFIMFVYRLQKKIKMIGVLVETTLTLGTRNNIASVEVIIQNTVMP